MKPLPQPLPQPDKRGGESGSQAEKWAGKLLTMFTAEQVEQLLEGMQVAHDNAVIREVEQTFTVLFNDKGHPRGFNGSNNVRPVKPVMYKAE